MAALPKKNPGGHGDTVEKGLGPRPLGPIGPTFSRTMTVTRDVKKLHFVQKQVLSIFLKK